MEQKKIEDSILKQASETFSKELLPYFGIHAKVVSVEQTELVTITLSRQYMDFNYLTEDNIIHHFEFQSTRVKTGDLRRFRTYESVMSMKTKKTVITHVIYSGNVKKPVSEFKDGLNVYRVDAISLREKDADILMGQIVCKMETGIALDRDDMITLILLPLMGGKMSKAKRIRDSLLLLKDAKTENLANPEIEQVQALVYAFAEKFLEGTELDSVREVLHMTRLGQMLVQEGVEKGIRIFIEDNLEEGIGRERILFKLQDKYGLNEQKALEYFAKYGRQD